MKKILSLLLAVCLAVALCACGGASSKPAASGPVELTVGTGGEAGTYYGYTGILGTVIGQKTDVKFTVVATNGSKDNLVNMADGVYDLATVQSDVMTYAFNGTNSFADSGAIQNFRVLCALYPETVQIVTVDPAIKSVEDLRGRSVCVGDVGSGTYFNAVDVLAAYGMTIDDVVPVYQSFAASADSLKDGKIDAAFVCAGAPTPAVTDLAVSKGAYLVSIDDEHMEKLLADCPWYAKLVIPAGTYAGFDTDAATVTVKATLVASTDVSDDVAYTIVKTIFENKDEIIGLHDKGKDLSLEFATEGIAVPFAPGAAKYFAENGVTVSTGD